MDLSSLLGGSGQVFGAMHKPQDIASTTSLERLTALVCDQLGCVGVLATQVTKDEQLILANAGVPLPARFQNSIPQSHSICWHSVAMDFPLVIDDTIQHPLLVGNLASQDLGIAAYLGAPIHTPEGAVFGTICAVEMRYRRWTDQNIELITMAAEIAKNLVTRSA